MHQNEEGEWYLAFIVGELEEGQTEAKTKITTMEIICHDSINIDKKSISEFHESLKLVQSVQINMHEFITHVVEYASEFLNTNHMDDKKINSISINFSRLLLNVLSMFRSFIDHSNLSISRNFGKDSEQFKEWKAIQSKQYDNVFGYRLFYALRNYCQHVGMPPMHISYSASIEQEGVVFGLDLIRSELLKERASWNQRLFKDLEAAPEKIPVVQTMDAWSKCFIEISQVLLNIKRNASLDAAQRIISHRARLELPQNVGKLGVIWLPKIKEKTDSLKLTIGWLPEDEAKEIVYGDQNQPGNSHCGT